MGKVLFLGDLHLGVRNANIVFMNMMKKYFNNELFPYILKNDIDCVIQLGDILDKRKSVDFITSNFLQNTFFKFFDDNKIPFYSTVGNHDLYYRQSVSVDGPSQFVNSDYIKIIKEPEIVEISGKEFALVPWICDENKDSVSKWIKKNSSKDRILCGHFELEGFPIQRGFMSDKGTIESSVLKKYHKVMSGHYHSPSSKGNVSYIGTPYQLTWSDYGDIKKIVVYDTEANIFEEIPTKIEMFHKIIYSDNLNVKYSDYEDTFVKVIISDVVDEVKLSSFLNSFEQSAHLHGLQVVNQLNNGIDEFEELSVTDVDEPIDIMVKVIEERIQDESLRDLVKSLSHSIYKEAQSMSV